MSSAPLQRKALFPSRKSPGLTSPVPLCPVVHQAAAGPAVPRYDGPGGAPAAELQAAGGVLRGGRAARQRGSAPVCGADADPGGTDAHGPGDLPRGASFLYGVGDFIRRGDRSTWRRKERFNLCFHVFGLHAHLVGGGSR